MPALREPVKAEILRIVPAEQAAHQIFEDEIIDRIFAMNAERAKEEEPARLSRGKKKTTKKDDVNARKQ